MYPRIPWDLVADLLGSAEYTLGTSGSDHVASNDTVFNEQ